MEISNTSLLLHKIQFYQVSCSYNHNVVVRFMIFFFCCGAATQRGSLPPHSWGFLDHTQRRTTVGRTPLDEWSARRRDLYLTTHNTHKQTNIHTSGGIRTHDLSRRAAADLRLRSRGYWDRPLFILGTKKVRIPKRQECKRLISVKVLC